MKTMPIIFMIICILMAVNIGCGKKDSELNVIGKWKKIEVIQGSKSSLPTKHSEIEFFKDNTFKHGIFSGTWNILEDGRIKLTNQVGGMVISTIDADGKLRIDYDGNPVEVYEKIIK